jgi:hypothetical protein
MKFSSLKRMRPLLLLIVVSLLFSNCATEEASVTGGSVENSSTEFRSRLIKIN